MNRVPQDEPSMEIGMRPPGGRKTKLDLPHEFSDMKMVEQYCESHQTFVIVRSGPNLFDLMLESSIPQKGRPEARNSRFGAADVADGREP